jgi:multidrug resistance efflux pump
MTSHVKRLILIALCAIVAAGAIALAQDKKTVAPTDESGVAVFNSVEGRTVVVSSRPEGARVEKGDIVCELDPSDLRDRLASQELVIQGCQADANANRIAREAAVMALIEYKEGTYRQEVASVTGDIKLAEATLTRAEDQLDWSRRMFEKGYVSLSEKNTNELRLQQARYKLEVAQGKRSILVDHSHEKTIKTLTGEVESARARELGALARLERERSTQRRLTDQIGRCKLAAPAAGQVSYIVRVGPGAVVHDGQLLFVVIPDGVAKTKHN